MTTAEITAPMMITANVSGVCNSATSHFEFPASAAVVISAVGLSVVGEVEVGLSVGELMLNVGEMVLSVGETVGELGHT